MLLSLFKGIRGVGLTQNANAKNKWELGPLTMAELYNRTLQTLPLPEGNSLANRYDLAAQHKNAGIPRAVIVSLGGNDYNHQKAMCLVTLLSVPHTLRFSPIYLKRTDIH